MEFAAPFSGLMGGLYDANMSRLQGSVLGNLQAEMIYCAFDEDSIDGLCEIKGNLVQCFRNAGCV